MLYHMKLWKIRVPLPVYLITVLVLVWLGLVFSQGASSQDTFCSSIPLESFYFSQIEEGRVYELHIQLDTMEIQLTRDIVGPDPIEETTGMLEQVGRNTYLLSCDSMLPVQNMTLLGNGTCYLYDKDAGHSVLMYPLSAATVD